MAIGFLYTGFFFGLSFTSIIIGGGSGTYLTLSGVNSVAVEMSVDLLPLVLTSLSSLSV